MACKLKIVPVIKQVPQLRSRKKGAARSRGAVGIKDIQADAKTGGIDIELHESDRFLFVKWIRATPHAIFSELGTAADKQKLLSQLRIDRNDLIHVLKWRSVHDAGYFFLSTTGLHKVMQVCSSADVFTLKPKGAGASMNRPVTNFKKRKPVVYFYPQQKCEVVCQYVASGDEQCLCFVFLCICQPHHSSSSSSSSSYVLTIHSLLYY
jgi:hypothetical protein